MHAASHDPRRTRTVLIATAMLLALTTHVHAQEPAFEVKAHYTKRDFMVPMRDGVKLFTIVYTPRDTTRTYPVILFRTPYSIRPYEPDTYRAVLGPSADFDRDGYIFVFQDVRGKFRSEGEFELLKPFKATKRGTRDVDESSDTYDTIEWLLANLRPNNGRVGMWGVSYPGWQVVLGMMDPHPALRAASPQASPADMFIGDDFHHNGAFRLMYAFSWLAGNARPRVQPGTEQRGGFTYGTPDGYRFFMEAGSAANIDSLYFRGEVPSWSDFIRHPDYDEHWQTQNVLRYLGSVPADLPILNVAGWFDAEDFYGPLSIYHTLEKLHPRNRSILAVGPWLHGGWNSQTGERLGPIEFGSPTSRHFQTEIQFPFFQCHLKDICTRQLAEATVFETGANTWRSYEAWPPRNTLERKLYFHANGRLSFDPPRTDGIAEYVHDPARPVPFSAEIRTTQGHLWMIEDQRFAATRPDVLVFESEPLTEDVTIAGPIMANLFASTSGTDADFVVKLIDVLPGDAPNPNPNPANVRMGHFQMLLAGEVFRAKYRTSYEQPTPMVAGQVTHIEFDLRDRYHTFRKGHRIMVQVQSSWFPVIDRNPGIFTDIYRATPSDYRRTTQRIHHSPANPSHIALRVIGPITEDRP